ncbi:MAG: hypothetical protein MJ231_01620 [bacterium]|nr:hypothetical protein [bacterium]
MSIQIIYEINLYNYFKSNDIELDIYDKNLQSENLIEEFCMDLLNLNWLPSSRGYFSSFLFSEKFACKVFSKYITLTIKMSYGEMFSIKIPKDQCSFKKDIFAGNLLRIKFDKFSLLFKLPNQFQSILYKSFSMLD